MISFTNTHPRIGIFRALQLGDLLCAIPAVRALRVAYPQAEIVWIGLPWTTSFVQRFSQYVDRCIIFPGYPGLPEQGWSPAAWEVFVERMKGESFDLIIQMQGNGTIVNTRYVCVHPGSRGAWRQWPPAYFARLADMCAEQGYKVILTGTQDELPLTTMVEELMEQPCINLAGRTTLGVVAALISKALLLISNCTGVSHIAAATQTPSIVISMDGEPERWGALNRSLHKTIDWLKDGSFDHVREEMGRLMDVMVERSEVGGQRSEVRGKR
jgi:ADP-heptose:LPS heptosyltransferase